jgi:hypothetical protein
MNMTPEQKEARYNMIKHIAQRQQKLQAIKKASNKVKAAGRRAQRWTDTVESKYEKDIPADDYTNINAWTDSEKYAEKHYGDVYRETTRFDKEWD